MLNWSILFQSVLGWDPPPGAKPCGGMGSTDPIPIPKLDLDGIRIQIKEIQQLHQIRTRRLSPRNAAKAELAAAWRQWLLCQPMHLRPIHPPPPRLTHIRKSSGGTWSSPRHLLGRGRSSTSPTPMASTTTLSTAATPRLRYWPALFPCPVRHQFFSAVLTHSCARVRMGCRRHPELFCASPWGGCRAWERREAERSLARRRASPPTECRTWGRGSLWTFFFSALYRCPPPACWFPTPPSSFLVDNSCPISLSFFYVCSYEISCHKHKWLAYEHNMDCQSNNKSESYNLFSCLLLGCVNLEMFIYSKCNFWVQGK